MEKKQFNVSLMNRNELCCIVCTVSAVDVECSTSKSYFHFIILKCRYIMAIMETRFVIGSPIPRSSRSFYIITTNKIYQSKFFKKILEEANLMTSEPQPVTHQAYLSCLNYTIDFYIAPEWNKVDNVYMESRDFWAKTENNSAVKIVTRLFPFERNKVDKISVDVIPLKARLFAVKLHNLCIPHSVITEFMVGSSDFINVELYEVVRVSVLPSMKKGRVLNVFNKIPPTCTFKNWTEMRRHWKNMYGYRLPESDNGIIYYEIYFPMFNTDSKTNIFIYPDLCVKLALSQFPCAENSDSTVKRFVSEFAQIIPIISGSSNPTIHEVKTKDEQSNQAVDEIKMKDVKNHAESSHNSSIIDNKNDNVNKKNRMKVATNIPMTPEKINLITEIAQSSRLSIPAHDRLNQRQISTPMSPTPSVLGKRKSSPNKFYNFHNYQKIKKLHDPKVSGIHKKPIITDTNSNENKQNNFNIFNKPPLSFTSSLELINDSLIQPGQSTGLNIFSNTSTAKEFNFQLPNSINTTMPQTNILQNNQLSNNNSNDNYKPKKPTVINNELVSKNINIKNNNKRV